MVYPGLWGYGIYFAKNAVYAHEYAFNVEATALKQVFYANVLVGESVQIPQDKIKRTAPTKTEANNATSGMFYDSVNAVTALSNIYVIYHAHRAYPAHLITYS